MSDESAKPATLRSLHEIAAAAARKESGACDLSSAEEELLSLATLVETGRPVPRMPHVEVRPARYRVR